MLVSSRLIQQKHILSFSWIQLDHVQVCKVDINSFWNICVLEICPMESVEDKHAMVALQSLELVFAFPFLHVHSPESIESCVSLFRIDSNSNLVGD